MPSQTKPPALVVGGTVRFISPASRAKERLVRQGMKELKRLGYKIQRPAKHRKPDGYFAASLERRTAELEGALSDPSVAAVICERGGYGSAALLDRIRLSRSRSRKLLVGFSDITVLHTYLWQRFGLPSVYGPMVAAGFDGGPGRRGGYDRASFLAAVSGTQEQWTLPLAGETLVPGSASGVVLGGCVTLLQTSVGTPWELDTRGALLLLEDVGVKPYQLDRMLVHLAQAGKFRGVRGIILGDFPKSGPVEGGVGMREVCHRLLRPLGIPVVFGAPIGHTSRPMLTVPLGVRARLQAKGEGKLEFLESPVRPSA